MLRGEKTYISLMNLLVMVGAAVCLYETTAIESDVSPVTYAVDVLALMHTSLGQPIKAVFSPVLPSMTMFVASATFTTDRELPL